MLKKWVSCFGFFPSPPITVQVKPDASYELKVERSSLSAVCPGSALLLQAAPEVSPALLLIYFVLGYCPRVMTNVLQTLIYITCA